MDNRTLPEPLLTRKRLASSLYVWTDDALFDATGIRIAFTERTGGASTSAFASLNLGSNTDDDPAVVAKNQALIEEALGIQAGALVRFNQVHGTNLVTFDSADALEEGRAKALAGADGALVFAPDIPVMLCFADCVPVALASPSGAFALVHAGWRGVVGKIAVKALLEMAQTEVASGYFTCAQEALASYNAYIGPYIHSECFEVGPEVHDRFVSTFGAGCAPDSTHIDLGAALVESMVDVGCDRARIADVDLCTRCHDDVFFSYRKSGGVCGRHAALGVRRQTC